VKYRLVERGNHQNVLAEGKTDVRGMTERVFTSKSKEVDVLITRLNDKQEEEEKTIEYVRIVTEACTCRKDYIKVVEIKRGRIFFDIRYVNEEKDEVRSFIKAAETQKRIAERKHRYDKYKGDLWWSFPVTTECGITTQWERLAKLQQKADMEIEEGHLFTHATKDGEDGKPGLTFAKKSGCAQDGTFTPDEIKKLPPLMWSSTSILWLYGCRTGLPLPSEKGETIADAFFSGQKTMKTVIALKGFGYFSYNLESYEAIASDINDTKDIYLWAFRPSHSTQFSRH
jgi:hypothetical protein